MAERERALLEEGIAQTGRLRAQVESAERETKEQPARTSAAANDPDGGTGAGTKTKAPKKDAPPPDDKPGSKDTPAPRDTGAPAALRDGGAR